ncbi:iron-containing alcohol dehydrogenase [Labilibaculum euxinus]|uniref:Iron-containing alcohol dehydrogenase n=1 Tax=Labilibaculum euxinus TaxID=2686357 RepID=A0A7M4D1Z9_9BACT|nr:iron-containing alcohol dehydrogenase [Labilibaculum euxinus]MUP36678.1 iron-containing alcohol dehydrogenase [Labilibaculum euxinus]MVB05883.1 iron-containing alcohol dehydrogenase [Labilibaculum euxinus]
MNTCRRIYLPPLSLVGPNALLELKDELAARGFTKALFVTDEILVKIGVAEKVEDVLKGAGLDYVTYSSVKQNPNTENVKEGLAILTENKCDCIITLGGGSPQDCGKAVGVLATNGGSIEDYEGIHVSKKKSLPIIAINTTAGTASEITINYVITDEKRKVKMVMVDKNCLVDIAVNDSMLMLNKPASLTAATGMDALTHAIEAYVTAGAFEWSDTLALKSIELIGSSLRDAVKDGQNIEARTKMAWGQFIAGQAFSNCGLGYVHSMAHQLGGMYDLPHGVCNAILLPYVEEFNAEVCGEKLGKVAEALGADTTGMSVDEKKKAAIAAIKKLSKDVGIPAGLKELNVDPKDFEAMAKNAMADVCTGGNPRKVSLEETIKIYEAAY